MALGRVQKFSSSVEAYSELEEMIEAFGFGHKNPVRKTPLGGLSIWVFSVFSLDLSQVR